MGTGTRSYRRSTCLSLRTFRNARTNPDKRVMSLTPRISRHSRSAYEREPTHLESFSLLCRTARSSYYFAPMTPPRSSLTLASARPTTCISHGTGTRKTAQNGRFAPPARQAHTGCVFPCLTSLRSGFSSEPRKLLSRPHALSAATYRVSASTATWTDAMSCSRSRTSPVRLDAQGRGRAAQVAELETDRNDSCSHIASGRRISHERYVD
jgi:hypothetical protein